MLLVISKLCNMHIIIKECAINVAQFPITKCVAWFENAHTDCQFLNCVAQYTKCENGKLRGTYNIIHVHQCCHYLIFIIIDLQLSCTIPHNYYKYNSLKLQIYSYITGKLQQLLWLCNVMINFQK